MTIKAADQPYNHIVLVLIWWIIKNDYKNKYLVTGDWSVSAVVPVLESIMLVLGIVISVRRILILVLWICMSLLAIIVSVFATMMSVFGLVVFCP